MKTAKINCRGRYGHLSSDSYYTFEVMRETYAKMGIEIKDLGNEIFEYEMELSVDSPMYQSIVKGEFKSCELQKSSQKN